MRRVGLLVFLVVLLVTAAWWMFLIGPRNARISDARDDLVTAQDAEQRLRVQIRQLQEIRDREVEYLAAMGSLESLIPERPLLDEFIEQISALAVDSDVDLQALTPSVPSPTEEGGDLREIAVSAQVEGQFFEILGFLFGLNEMERLVRIDGISLASSQSETGGTILSAALDLRLFTLADLLPPLDDLALPGDDEATSTTTTSTTTTVPDGGSDASGVIP